MEAVRKLLKTLSGMLTQHSVVEYLLIQKRQSGGAFLR